MLGPVGQHDDHERLQGPLVPRAIEPPAERVYESGVCHGAHIMRRPGEGLQGLLPRRPTAARIGWPYPPGNLERERKRCRLRATTPSWWDRGSRAVGPPKS